MKISDALKKDNSLRVVNGDRWLVFDPFNNEWIVHERKPRKHHTQELGRTVSEEMAISILTKP